MVRFEPMSEVEFAAYCEHTIVDYAAAHVRAGTYPAEGSVRRARDEFTKLLPEGLKSPGHTLVHLLDDATGAHVGILWWAERPPGWFIYDIEIRPEHRRKGHAQAALLELGRRAQAAGIRSIDLHVFGDNAGAITLYERLGFVTTHRLMSLPVPPASK
jgi:ribosomal protein S18 acetylase RimI-like enzyme